MRPGRLHGNADSMSRIPHTEINEISITNDFVLNNEYLKKH